MNCKKIYEIYFVLDMIPLIYTIHTTQTSTSVLFLDELYLKRNLITINRFLFESYLFSKVCAKLKTHGFKK